MKFDEALRNMKSGIPMKLPSWGGYWYWDPDKETIMMKCRAVDSDTGKDLLDIRETQRVEYTLMNVLSDEWTPATSDNATVLGGTPTFGFGDAIKYLKRGLKVKRQGWNGKDQYIMYIDPYMNETYKITELSNSDGTLYPYFAIKTNYNGIVPWFASTTDMLAEDWTFED